MIKNHKAMFVVNPVSGGGRTRKKWQTVENELRHQGYDFEVSYTEKPMHASQIVSEALQTGYNHIIAVGGDGTINEVLNGFYQVESDIRQESQTGLSVLPMGTASDFSRVLQPSTKIEYIEGLLQKRREQTCDVVRASFTDWDGKAASRYFINVADIGIGSDTVVRVNRNSKAMGGFLSFLIACLVSIYLFKNPTLTVEVDGEVLYSGPSSMVAINNGRYFGGGMMIAPYAQITDGLLDITILEGFGKTEFLKALPTVYKGKHLNHPRIRLAQGKKVHIKSQDKVYLEVDGESPGSGDVEIEILPGDIKLFI